MTIQTNFIKASSRKEAIFKSRRQNSIQTIEALTARAFKVTDVHDTVFLALVTDVVTGKDSDNLFKVEIDLFPFVVL